MQNIQTVNKLIAREHGIKESLVESVNSFYWKAVRKTLSNLEDSSVSLKHIGTITTSRRKLVYFIRNLIWKIRGIRDSKKLKESTKALLLEYNYGKLKKALIQRNILAKQYYDEHIRQLEKVKRVHISSTNNSGELRQDSRGDSESSEAAVQYAS